MALKKETSYDCRLPWDGLAETVAKETTAKAIMKKAGLNWTVTKEPVIVNGRQVPNFFGLQRSSDKSVLDIVGKSYIPTQNEALFDFLQDFVRKGKSRIETAGSLNKGRVVWALVSLDHTFKLPGNDNVRSYLFLGSPFIRGKSLIARVTTLRDVCNNTLSIALRKGRHGIGDTFRMNHRNEFDEVQTTRAREVLDLARDQVDEFASVAHKLKKQRVSDKDAISILAPVFQHKVSPKELIADNDKLSPKMRSILDAYKNAPGADPGNAWGLLNAVTYFSDHMASRTDDKRLTNAWLGRTANQKQLVLEALVNR